MARTSRFDPNAYGNPVRKSALQQQAASNSGEGIKAEPSVKNQVHGVPENEENPATVDNIKTYGPELIMPERPLTDFSNQYPSTFSGGLTQSKYASGPDLGPTCDPPLALVVAGNSTTISSRPANEDNKIPLVHKPWEARTRHFKTSAPGFCDDYEGPDQFMPSRPTINRAVRLISAHARHGQKGTNMLSDTALRSDRAEAHLETKMPTSSRGPSQPVPVSQMSGNDGIQLSVEEQLNQVRQKKLRDIQNRNRTKDGASTTSLRDLDIARKPATSTTNTPPLKPQGRQSSHIASPYASSPAGNTPHSSQVHVAATKDWNRRVSNDTTQSRHGRGNPIPYQWQEGAWNEPFCKTGEGNSASRATDSVALTDIAAKMDKRSDAGGSPIQSNASEASDDSLRLLHDGKVLHNKAPSTANSLADWEGKMRPPPADWNSRSRFNSNNPENYDAFARWNDNVAALTVDGDKVVGPCVSYSYLSDLRYHPDGIWLVLKDTVVNPRLAQDYGYLEPMEVTKYVQPLQEHDFEDWGKLDMRRPENKLIEEETTDTLVDNWLRNTEERRKLIASQVVQEQEQKQKQLALELPDEVKSAPNPNRPALNIYLRPACVTDVSQMTTIYNWYVENSPLTAEMHPVPEEDIHGRLQDAISTKLPLIVAIENNKKAAIPFDDETESSAMNGHQRSTTKADRPGKDDEVERENVGWASAQDFTASDYVERISAEIEIFVDPTRRQMGIGKCLMDQLLDACDRGYFKRGGYHFHCPQETRHLYNSGGGRDLHKIMILLRKWKHPKKPAVKSVYRKGAKKPAKKYVDDMEDGYEVWLQKWLESWGFEVEGVLKGVGAKNGRFLDVVYLGKETGWQPAEGHIPNPLPFQS